MPYHKLMATRVPMRPETPVRGERFRAALQTRFLGRAGLGDGENLRAILLERGRAVVRTASGESMKLEAPVMGWFPWEEGMRLELGAGAKGSHLLIGLLTLQRILKRWPEDLEMAVFHESHIVLDLKTDTQERATIVACFEGILAETLRPGLLSASAMESYLHVVLIHMHRAQALSLLPKPQSGGSKALAAEFIRLVERHFRERWTVELYAKTMHISRDRLNDICLRVYGRSPGRLQRERIALEARQYLTSSPLELDQIAGVLGFTGAAQFSRFFNSIQGQPPGKFRKMQANSLARTPSDAAYAWP